MKLNLKPLRFTSLRFTPLRFTLLLSLLLSPLPAPPPPERAVVWEVTAPPPTFHPLPDGSVEIVVGDFEVDGRSGAPRLPYTSTLIALPPGAVPQLRILSAETYTASLPGPVAVAPQVVGVERDRAGSPIGPRLAPADTTIPPPSRALFLEEVGVVRGVRLARLTFYPALPAGDHLQVTRRLRVEVRWRESGVGAGARPSSDDPLLQAVRRAVLNLQDAIPAPAVPPTGLSFAPAGGGAPVAFLEVRAPGLYRVSCGDLIPLGFGSVNPNFLRLFRGDDEVLMEWQGDGDTLCESGEAFYFYAEPRFSRWTAADVYRLVPAAPGPNWMPTRSADPTGLPLAAPWVEQTFEENREYTPDRFTSGVPLGRDGDRWAWDYLLGPMATPKTYSFSLTAADTAVSLTLWAIGHTATDHRWAVQVNGVAVGEVAWSGKTAVTATFAIPPGVLRSGDNTLALRSLLSGGAWLDAFAVRYVRSATPAGALIIFGERASHPPSSEMPLPLPHRLYLPLVLRGAQAGARAYRVALAVPGPYRAYDITDPLRPVRLTGFRVDGSTITLGDPPEGGPRRYLVMAESGIRAPDRIRPREELWGVRAAGGAVGADYLIITHPAFAEALGPLIDLRRSQGLTVATANVLGIYDTYGDGRPDPEAIRRFIAHMYATGDPRPRYVLLVGDGSYDPRQYRSTSPPTFIPPYLADVESYSSETAADNRYVCVDGDDNLPDLLLGRLPVRSVEQARAVVEKIVRYETAPFPGGWNVNVLLVADDRDAAGDFAALSEAAAAYVTDPFTVTRRYCNEGEPDADDCPPARASAIHAALMSDWNQGALVVQYAGHSSWQQWAAERFFHLDDLPALANFRRLPVVAEMTCFTSAFHRPEATLDEELLLRPEAGAVATWGPSGLGPWTGHRRLSEGFFRAVFSDTVGTVGEAALAGKLNLLGAGQGQDLIDTFHLLGDPALGFQRTVVSWAAHVFLPLVSRSW